MPLICLYRTTETNSPVASRRFRGRCRVRGLLRHHRHLQPHAGRPQEVGQRGRLDLRGQQQQLLCSRLHLSDHPHEP